MHSGKPESECRIDTSRVRGIARVRAAAAVDLRVAMSRVRITLSARRRAAAIIPLMAALLSWFAVPGQAADYHLDASGDRYGTIRHGIGGGNDYPIHIPGFNNENAGTLLMHQIGGGDVEAYCIDLRGVRNPAAVFTTGERRIDPVAYVLGHHYPVIPGAGALADLNHEAAAVQLAVWVFSDGVRLDSVTAPGVAAFGAVLDRARDIARDAAVNWSAWAVQQGSPPAIALRAGAPVPAPGAATLVASVTGGPSGSVADGTPIVFTVSSAGGAVDGQRTAIRPLSGGQAAVQVSASAPGVVTVSAQVTVNGDAYLQLVPNIRPNQTLIVTSPVPVSGQGSQNLTFTGTPQLTLAKTVSVGGAAGTAVEAKPGDTINYSIQYANHGNAVASAVTVSDDLGKGELAHLPIDAVTLGGGAERSVDEATRLASWSIGDLPPGGSGVVTIAVRVPQSLPDQGQGVSFCNSGVITSTETGAVPSNLACAHVTTRPHLITVKVVDSGTAVPGQTLHYTVTVRNDGNRELKDLTVTDVLSGNNLDTLVKVRPSDGGAYDAGSRTLRWSVAQLGSGQSAAVTFDADIPAGGPPTGAATCYVNAAVAGGGNSGGTYPSERVSTCVHAPAPGLPMTGGGPHLIAAARASLTAPVPRTRTLRGHGPLVGTGLPVRIGIVVLGVLLSTVIVVTGLRRESVLR